MKRMLLCAAMALTSLSALQAADIVETAVSAGQFNTLVKAVQAAGLVETLKGPGPFTVFAPTDAAFAKLPPGALDSLIANPDKLKAVLTYHVVAGKVMSSQVKPGKVKTVEGAEATLSTKGGKVMIDKATVVKADVEASNGVIGTGILVAPALGGTGIMDYTTGKIADYDFATQVWAQTKAVLMTLCWSGIGSAILYKVVDFTVGLRPSVEKEREGLDLTDHGERAYTM